MGGRSPAISAATSRALPGAVVTPAFMPDREPHARPRRMLAEQRQPVGPRNGSPSMRGSRSGLPVRQITHRAAQHAREHGGSTCASSVSNWRDEPISNWPVGRGCTLNATDVPSLACALAA